MHCSSCGSLLPPGATHCPTCGAPVFADTPYRETAGGSSATQPPDKTLLSSGSNPFGPPQPPQPSGPGWQVDPAAPTEQYNIGALPGAINQAPTGAINQASTPGGAYGPPPGPGQQPYFPGGSPPPYGPPPEQPRRRPARGMVVLLAALAVLIILVGGGLIYYSTVFHPAQLHAQATSTAQTQQTHIADATGTANTQATGTAVAVANATATANAQATAFVVATQTALQNLYTSSTRGTPTLSESLAFQTSSNWDVDQAQGGGGCGFSGGAYHASLDSKGFYFPCFGNNTNFGNFAMQVQMTIVSGDAGGIMFRANGGASKSYAWQIDTSGIYNLFVSRSNTQSTSLLYGPAPSFKQHTGQTNLLTVIARGSSIYLYVNKQYVGNVSDNTYGSGELGFMVYDHTNPTDVAFSNLQVWQL
jgi:hypothetical protein